MELGGRRINCSLFTFKTCLVDCVLSVLCPGKESPVTLGRWVDPSVPTVDLQSASVVFFKAKVSVDFSLTVLEIGGRWVS